MMYLDKFDFTIIQGIQQVGCCRLYILNWKTFIFFNEKLFTKRYKSY